MNYFKLASSAAASHICFTYIQLYPRRRAHIASLTDELAAKTKAVEEATSRSEGLEAAKAAAAVYEADLERSHVKCADLERRLEEALTAAEKGEKEGVSEEDKKSLEKVSD